MKKLIGILCSSAVLCSAPLVSSAESLEFSDGSVQAEITEYMFDQTSTGYHRDIACLASLLSCASYNGNREKGYYINSAYQKLGFDIKNDVTLFGYEGAENNAKYKNSFDFNEDSLAFSLATREIGDQRLLIIALRGTNLDSTSDILHDISIFGTDFCEDYSPTGFLNFFVKVSAGLDLYLDEHSEIIKSAEENKLKILVTGHSLGGAGANLTGTYFNIWKDHTFRHFYDSKTNDVYSKKLNIPSENIFTYTFACPNTYYGNADSVNCDNVINVINESDIIPELPDGKKFGQSVFFDSGDSSGFAGHAGFKYTGAVESEIPDGIRYYNGGVDCEFYESMFDFNYSQELMLLSSALSASAYKGRYSDGYYIESAYKFLGFDRDYISLYGYDTDDRCFSLAYTELGSTPLLARTFKGNTGISDYLSELSEENYYDFYRTAQTAIDDYFSSHPEIKTDSLKLLITGHGIGGAVAQITGSQLIESGHFDEKNIIVYTFDCPNISAEMPEKNYSSFYNLLNSKALESFVPFGMRYGTDFFFKNGEWGERNCDPDIFISAVENSELENYSYNLFSFSENSADIQVCENGKFIPVSESDGYFENNGSGYLLCNSDFELKITGNCDEKISFDVKHGNNGSSDITGWRNIKMTDGKTVEYQGGKLLVLDKKGIPKYEVDVYGNETKYIPTTQNKANVIFFTVSGIALVSVLTSVIFGKKSQRKKPPYSDGQ